MGRDAKPLLYGTLDTLIMKTLVERRLHGYGIARWLEDRTSDGIQVDESSLYPALYRLEKKGLLQSKWGRSELDRRAKFYSLTAKGRKRLAEETAQWESFSRAVSTVLLEPSQERGPE